MESLIIVDRQKDFGNKFGALYVPGAEETEANTVIYIEKNHLRVIGIHLNTVRLSQMVEYGLIIVSNLVKGQEFQMHSIMFV